MIIGKCRGLLFLYPKVCRKIDVVGRMWNLYVAVHTDRAAPMIGVRQTLFHSPVNKQGSESFAGSREKTVKRCSTITVIRVISKLRFPTVCLISTSVITRLTVKCYVAMWLLITKLMRSSYIYYSIYILVFRACISVPAQRWLECFYRGYTLIIRFSMSRFHITRVFPYALLVLYQGFQSTCLQISAPRCGPLGIPFSCSTRFARVVSVIGISE